MKEWTVKDIFLLVVSIVFLLLFWGSAVSILGLSASYYDMLKNVNNIKFDNEDLEAIRGAVFFLKILLYSIPLLSIISIILVVTKQRKAAHIILLMVANFAVIVIFVLAIGKDESAGKIFKDGLETIKKAGGFSLYSYMILEVLLVILYPFLPGSPLVNNNISGTSSASLPTRGSFSSPASLPPGSIECPACHMVQALDSRFCKSCGRPLAKPCSQCQTLLGPDARFCPKCGHFTTPTCPKCKKPFEPAGKFCEHCGAPPAPPPPSAEQVPATTGRRKEIFVGGMQFIQNPAEEGVAFCAECGKKDGKKNMYYNDEIQQHVHRDCLMSLQENPEDK